MQVKKSSLLQLRAVAKGGGGADGDTAGFRIKRDGGDLGVLDSRYDSDASAGTVDEGNAEGGYHGGTAGDANREEAGDDLGGEIMAAGGGWAGDRSCRRSKALGEAGFKSADVWAPDRDGGSFQRHARTTSPRPG